MLLAPGTETLEAARQAYRMLKPRTGGKGGKGGGGKEGGGGSGSRGPLSASALSRVAELLLLLAEAPPPSTSSSSSSSPSLISPGRTAAWRHPAARARLSAGRGRFRAAVAALAATTAETEAGAKEAEAKEAEEANAVAAERRWSSTPADSLLRLARPLASFAGTPVDLEVVFLEGNKTTPVALFIGLPGDYGDRSGEESRRKASSSSSSRSSSPSPPSSSSPSSATLTSVAKRLRRAGFPAAILPYWEFDAAAERGRLREAIVEAARAALERGKL